MAVPDHETAVRWLEQICATLVLCGHWHELGGVVERKMLGARMLGARMFGFRAGTFGDAEGSDGVCVCHVIDLLESRRYTVSERAFSRKELE